MIRGTIAFAFLGFLAVGSATQASAEEVVVAVTSNFYATLKSLQPDYEMLTGNTLTIVNGTTSQLATQIKQGAPYDVLLAVDDKATKDLTQAGFAVPHSEIVYAVGVLALYSTKPSPSSDGIAILRSSAYSRLAVTRDTTGPYGAAAWSILNSLGVTGSRTDKIHITNDTEGTSEAIISKTADLAFLPYSRLVGEPLPRTGNFWIVPSDLYNPIRQTAVLLSRAKDRRGAKDLLEFLQSPGVTMSIEAAGYQLPNS